MAEFEFEDVELINGFREESIEHMEVVESKLLEMESGGVSQEDVNTVFRSIHTIKGGSGFLGFVPIKELSHGMESLLDMVRNGKIEMSPEVADALLKGTDLLNAMIGDLESQDEISYTDVLQELDRLMQGGSAPAEIKEEVSAAGASAVPTGGSVVIEKEDLEKYLGKGFNVYRLPLTKASHQEKLKKKKFDTFRAYLDSFGCLVWEDGGLEDAATAASEIVFATVLDEEFACASLKVEPDQIRKLSKDDSYALFDVPADAPHAPAPAKVAAATPAPSPEPKKEKAPAAAKPAAEKAPSAPAQTEASAAKTKGKKTTVAAAQTDSTIRVSTSLLNKLMNLAGELILSRNQLVAKLDNKDLPELHSLNHRVSELQESVMQTRLQQVGAVFSKVPRMVRDLSKSLGKEIEVVLEGVEVELDRTIIDSITDPLTHLVRNSIDHGIEMPDERIAAGKPPGGTLSLRAYHEGGQVNLEIKDDGKGINPEILKAKALEKGIVTPAEVEAMGKREALNIIFRPGFSTAQQVTEISGRGVGMDVVKTSFEKLGGTVDLSSELGQGTTILVKLPTTLAIVSAVIVDTEGNDFAIPQTNIEEIVRVKEHEIASKLERVGRFEIFRLRGMLLPVLRLADVLQVKRSYRDAKGVMHEDRRENLADRRSCEETPSQEIQDLRSGHDRRTGGQTFYIVVMRVGVNKYGVLVNRIKDVEEVVVKPLSAFVKTVKAFHGATILGDGRVVMILDVNGVASKAELKFEKLQDISDRDLAGQGQTDSQAFLIFNNHPDESFALPLSFITRIERVNAANIETMGDEEYIQIGGRNVPLFRLESKINCKKGVIGEDGTMYLLIPNLVRSPYAIVATKVQDVISTRVEVEAEAVRRPGVLGSTIIKKKMTLVLDIYGLFNEKRESGMLRQGESFRILLAEDQPFFRSMIRTYLEEHGMKVDEALNGQQAWDMLQHNPYDLVLSDIEMPVMDGFELVNKIKSSGMFPALPVMAITALDNPEAKARGRQSGFDAYQIKLDKNKLINTIDKILGCAQEEV